MLQATQSQIFRATSNAASLKEAEKVGLDRIERDLPIVTTKQFEKNVKQL